MKKVSHAYLLCLPAFLLVAGIALFPILYAVYLSFFEISIRSFDPQFAGFDHYRHLLTDKRVWGALGVTCFFTAVSVAMEFFLGLGLALLLHRALFGRGLIRAVGLLPWAIPTVVSAMLWQFIFNDQYGAANDLFTRFGLIRESHSWLGTSGGALSAIVIADVWKTTPFVALLILAGLQNISEEMLESASLDGAGSWQKFWYINLPILKPVILVTLLFRTLDAFRIFDLVYVLTGGGPGNATETLSVYTYKTLFSFGNFGYGSALAVFTAVCVGFISLIYVVGLRKAQT